MNAEQKLTNKAKNWQRKQGLPTQCCYEQLHEEGLTEYQKQWLKNFILLWDRATE